MADKRIKDRKIKLLVGGEFYTDKAPYLELINDLNISDSVILSNDFIPDSEVYKYFCASDIVVQPYKNATQSGVTQIAYNFNKPMIITNVGGLEEFVPDNVVGFVVNPQSEEVANAIIRFYDENKEKEFISNILEIKEKYSWKYFMNNLKSLFNL